MARPAWTDIPTTDVDQDSPGKEGDVFQALRDNAAAARIALFGVDWAADNTSSATYVSVAGSDFTVTLPSLVDYTGIQRRVLLDVEAWVSSGTGNIRLIDVTNAVNGAAQNVTATGAAHVTLEVNAVAGTALYRVEFRHPTAATINCRAEDHYTGRAEY